MRAIFLMLIVAVVGLIAAIQLGLVDISQTRPAEAPSISVESGVIRAEAGQTPAFDVETGSVGVTVRDANVAVPVVEVKRAEEKTVQP